MSQAPSSPSSAASYPTSGVSYLTPTPPKAKSESPAAQTPDLEAHSALSASTAPPSSLGHNQTQAQPQIQAQTQAAPAPSSPNRAGPRLLSSSPSGSVAASNASVTEQLERLTDAILKVGDGLEQCKRASERRAAAEDERYAAKAGEGGTSMQAQLARMMAMQREVRERGREPIKGTSYC